MPERNFLGSSRLRSLGVGVAGALAVVLLLRIMPGPGAGGTPAAIVFHGLVLGLLNGLIAAGIILIYRSSRVINFAQASIGGAGAIFTYHLVMADTTRLPYVLAFFLGILVSGGLGAGVEIAFVRRFFNAPRLVLTVLTIALISGLGLAASQVPSLPFFGDPQTRSVQELGASEPIRIPFASFNFTIGKLPLQFGFPHLFAIIMSLAALGALAAFLRFTKSGVATRAAAENSDRAMLLGINVKGLSTIVWSITGALSGVGMILAGTIGAFSSVGFPAPEVFIAALAAAVIGRMRSIPIAVATAVGLELLRSSVQYNLEEQLAMFNVFVFLVIIVGLLWQRRERQRSEEGEVSSWQAAKEFRSIPKEMAEISGVRVWRRVAIAIAVIAVLIFPWVTTTGTTNFMAERALATIALVSLVILTGWAGQVSLGQWALLGFGTLIGGWLIGKVGISFWLAVPLGALATSVFALLIGLPALRIRGLYLAVTTGAFAFASEILFNQKIFGWLHPESVPRPTLLFFDFDDERSMYYLSVFALMLVIIVVTILRKSRPGRILIALRDNEPNAQSFGVNIVLTKLSAFALSGFLCGFAGVIFAVHQRAVSVRAFPPVESLNTFIFAVIGGIGSVSGAVLGGLYWAASRQLAGNPLLQLIVGPIGLLFLLYIAPSGLAGIFYGLRDSVLRIVAVRKGMVVPSLFADVDPESLERRLAPLAEAIPGVGLVSLPFNQRYKVDSHLYGARGKLVTDGRKSRDEAKYFGAATKGMEDEGVVTDLSPVPAGNFEEAEGVRVEDRE